MAEPVTRNCYRPQLVSLPAVLLDRQTNVLDIHVQGAALQHVSARARAGGLSALRIGPVDEMTSLHERRQFWSITTVQITGITLIALGGFLLILSWINRSEIFLLYFGSLLIGWALLSLRVWWPHWPWDTRTFEVLVCTAFAPVVALAVQFLLSYAQVRSRLVEIGLLLQCVLMPISLLLAAPDHLFTAASAWYVAAGRRTAGRHRAVPAAHLEAPSRRLLADGRSRWLLGLLVLIELAIQYDWLPMLPVQPLHFALPLLLLGIGVAAAAGLRARTADRRDRPQHSSKQRVQEITAEIERNFAQLAELRVEQVTEKERKRIAADLHDDLGAKLLTIVHTSESERISTLAREALEEMRLSVRGLTGKPVRLADALADWRAETVSRLGQANIEVDWRSPADELDQQLPARGFVQTTRILREAVSNIIKHSGASHCKVRCLDRRARTSACWCRTTARASRWSSTASSTAATACRA